jgi:hypothetical protein
MIDTRTIVGVVILVVCLLLFVGLIIISVVRKRFNIAPGPQPAIELLPSSPQTKRRRDKLFKQQENPWETADDNNHNFSGAAYIEEDDYFTTDQPTQRPLPKSPKSPSRNPPHKVVDDGFDFDDGEQYATSRRKFASPKTPTYIDNDDMWDEQLDFETDYMTTATDLTTTTWSPTTPRSLRKLNDKIDRAKDKVGQVHDKVQEKLDALKQKMKKDVGSLRVKKQKEIARPVIIRRQDSVSEKLATSIDIEEEEHVTSKQSSTQRRMILEEFLHTEQTYVFALQTLFQFFVEPLENTPSEHGVKPKFVKAVFSDIKQIFETNTVFLQQLEKIIPDNDDDSTAERALSEELIKWCEAFKQVYVPYIGAYQSIMKRIARQKKKKSRFADFIQKQVEMLKEERNVGQLSSLMITPVQRIPRYRLLLESLIKVDDEQRSEEDTNRLNMAQESIKEVAEYCNEKEREIESMAKMYELSRELGKKDLIKPGRILLLETQKLEYEQSNGRTGHCNIFLFNDILVIQKKSKVKKPREVLLDKDIMAIEGDHEKEFKLTKRELLGRQGVASKELVNPNAPRAKGDYLMKFICETTQERKQWIDVITTLVEHLE